MWKEKKHPSGAWSRLKLTLYVICKANCNHRLFLLPQPILLKFSLSVWFCLSFILSFFPPFSSIILLSTCLVFFYSSLSLCRLFLFLLPLSLFPSLSWSVLVLLFRCHILSAAFFCHFFLGSCLFAHHHRHAHIHTRKHTHTRKCRHK